MGVGKMGVGNMEVYLVMGLKAQRDLESSKVSKAAELLAKPALETDLKGLAQELMQLADLVMMLVPEAQEFVEWSGSAVGKGVAEETQEVAEKLYEMKRKCVVHMEEALEVALGEIKESVPGLLEKAKYLIDSGAQRLERVAFAQELEYLASTADDLRRKALAFVEWSVSELGTKVAQEALENSSDLNTMARELRYEYYPSIEQMEEAMPGKPFTQKKMKESTHDTDVLALTYEGDVESMKCKIEELERQVKELARLLKEHVELNKVGEAGDNHPLEGEDEKKVTS